MTRGQLGTGGHGRENSVQRRIRGTGGGKGAEGREEDPPGAKKKASVKSHYPTGPESQGDTSLLRRGRFKNRKQLKKVRQRRSREIGAFGIHDWSCKKSTGRWNHEGGGVYQRNVQGVSIRKTCKGQTLYSTLTILPEPQRWTNGVFVSASPPKTGGTMSENGSTPK